MNTQDVLPSAMKTWRFKFMNMSDRTSASYWMNLVKNVCSVAIVVAWIVIVHLNYQNICIQWVLWHSKNSDTFRKRTNDHRFFWMQTYCVNSCLIVKQLVLILISECLTNHSDLFKTPSMTFWQVECVWFITIPHLHSAISIQHTWSSWWFFDELFSTIHCSPDCAPSNFHLFPKMKKFLGVVHLESGEAVKLTAALEWFTGLVADFFNVGIQKIVWQ